MSSYRYDVGYQIRLEKLVMKAFMLVFLVVVPVHAAKLDCVIEASEEANVSSSVRGVMSVVEVKRGDWVEKGQVLALIESSVEQASVDLARARAFDEALALADSTVDTVAEEMMENYLRHMLVADDDARRLKHDFMLRVFDAAVLLETNAVCGFVGRNYALEMDW